MKFLNFKEQSEKSCITSSQLELLLSAEEKAAEKEGEIFVSLVHKDFDGQGSRLIVIQPVIYFDKDTNSTYKYEAYFLDATCEVTKSFSERCGLYLNFDIAKFEADGLYGAQNREELSKRVMELAPRVENVQDYITKTQEAKMRDFLKN